MDPSEFTELFRQSANGEANARSQLYDLVYAQLRDRAHLLMASERADHTLETTDLLHETWLRLFSGQATVPGSRAEFLRIASKAMRNVLVDHARRKATAKRGSGYERTPLDLALEGLKRQGCDVLDLSEALDSLRDIDASLAGLVELRFFGGATLKECADVLGCSLPTAERKWGIARFWLRSQLEN
ncbi:MAG TPA: ECF-type sigma factor [Planctomycetota bacterium]|jgi:RNA polymerase sigma factor (TIGR02999 family)|nr:ECF-type sigma factor [Planctomycetota bacterium]